jgi:hypothetical protein
MSLAEGLFEAEAELRGAASEYSNSLSSAQTTTYKNKVRSRLREAALAYAKHANYIDDLHEQLEKVIAKESEQ